MYSVTYAEIHEGVLQNPSQIAAHQTRIQSVITCKYARNGRFCSPNCYHCFMNLMTLLVVGVDLCNKFDFLRTNSDPSINWNWNFSTICTHTRQVQESAEFVIFEGFGDGSEIGLSQESNRAFKLNLCSKLHFIIQFRLTNHNSTGRLGRPSVIYIQISL